MFQGITAFVFIIIFCNDKHNQAIVSQKNGFGILFCFLLALMF